MHSVTSNAVANSVNNLQNQIDGKAGGDGYFCKAYFTPAQFNDPAFLTNYIAQFTTGTMIVFCIGWEDYTIYPYAGYTGYIIIAGSSGYAFGFLKQYSSANYTQSFYWINEASVNRFSGIINL